MSTLNQFILEFAPRSLEQPKQAAAIGLDDIFSDRTHLDRVRPLRMLQLSKHSLCALEKTGTLSTGGAYDAWQRGHLNTSHFSPQVVEELAEKFRILEEFIDQESARLDWIEYAHDQRVGISWLCFSSPSFGRLHPADAQKGIASLHFFKAQNPLREQGWDTIGKLIGAVEGGISDVRNLGRKAFEEIASSVLALSRSIDSEGNVNWLSFAEIRGLTVIPSTNQWLHGNEELIMLLPEMARETVVISGKGKELAVFDERLMKSREERPTLEKVGQQFQVTRERIRQLEALSISRIRNAIFDGDYDQTLFRFRPEVETLVRRASRFLSEFGERIWKTPEWIRELATIWEVPEQFISRNLTLITEILGYGEYSGRGSGDGWLVFPASVTKEMRQAQLTRIEVIEDILADKPLPIRPLDLLPECNQRLGDNAILPDDLEQLFDLSDRIVTDDQGLISIRFDLLTLGQQALRVIVESGEPLHYNEIARLIDERNPESKASEREGRITAHFVRQSQLSPIGRTGQWTWVAWDIETGTVSEVAQRALEEAGEALTSSQLHEEVAAKRPIAATSLRFILQKNPSVFTELGPNLWGLKKWGDAALATSGHWTHEALSAFLEDFFAEEGTDEVVFSKLRKQFEQGSGYTTPQASGILRAYPRLSIETRGRARYARLLTEAETAERISRKRRERSVQHGANWNAIQRWLDQRFDNLDEEACPLVDLVKGVETDLGIARHITYGVISNSEQFETFQIEGTPTKLCRRVSNVAALATEPFLVAPESVPTPIEVPVNTPKKEDSKPELAAAQKSAFPGESRIRQSIGSLKYHVWRDELTRGLDFMTPSNVDIALICAGRAFDEALRVLLEIAERKNKIPVDRDRDHQGLKSRIDWAVRYRLFDDSDELHLLRKERNQHAHNITSKDRTQIWTSGPFLFGKYVDYIIVVERHLARFLGAASAA
ncbi:MAG: hypothetical protein JNK37_14820 [Verrucomicrobiales bacterium]|nr:hypothetical protein [Verrucomicrobiales bacterium]